MHFRQPEYGIRNLWLDEEGMTDNIEQQMCRGINQYKLVIIFIAKTYVDKVNGQSADGDNDNCLKEFNYVTETYFDTIETLIHTAIQFHTMFVFICVLFSLQTDSLFLFQLAFIPSFCDLLVAGVKYLFTIFHSYH